MTKTHHYVLRTYPSGVRSCGGPYSLADAHYMAGHMAPANAMTVRVDTRRNDPEGKDGRQLLMRVRLLPGHELAPVAKKATAMVGPFASRKEAKAFLAAAAANLVRPLTGETTSGMRGLGHIEVEVAYQSSPNTRDKWESDPKVHQLPGLP